MKSMKYRYRSISAIILPHGARRLDARLSTARSGHTHGYTPPFFNLLLGSCKRTRAQSSATLPGPGKVFSPRCKAALVGAAVVAYGVRAWALKVAVHTYIMY